MGKINEKPTPSILRPHCEMFAMGSCKVTNLKDCAECRDNIWKHHRTTANIRNGLRRG